MGHLIGPNMVPWNDFCHIKNLKFTLPLQCPINKIKLFMGEFGALRVKTDPKFFWISQTLTLSLSN